MEELLATPGHCRYAFDVLLAKLNNQQIPPYPQGLPDPSAPIFVTWKINGKLNGCIGTFAASKMSKTLSRFALISAFEDDRFPQLTLNDLPKLNVVVSMLKNFRTAKSPYDF